MSALRSAARSEAAVLLLFPLLAVLLLWEVAVGGRVLLPAEYLKAFSPWSAALTPDARQTLPQWNALQWDGMAEFYPWRLHLARSFAEGLIPLWNPHILAGTPFLANSQSAPLYPLHLIYALPLGAPVEVRMGWLALVHLSLAGAIAYLLARDLGARPAAAAVGGAAYELSGFAVAWLELPSFISVGCWIPLLLLCLGRAVRRGSWSWGAAAGAALGLMLLAGHLQIAFYGLIAAGCVWLAETAVHVREGRGRPLLGRSVAIGLAALVIGLALAAPQLLSSVELSRISHRAGAPSEAGYAAYVKYAMPLWHWITLVVPDYYGLPGRGDYWGLWQYGAPNVMEYAGHTGAAALILALIGVGAACLSRQRALVYAAIAIVALLLAAGSPLCMLFYFYVPGFAQSGSPARALGLFCLAQAMLAAVGVESLLRTVQTKWKKPAALLSGVLLAVVAGTALLHVLAVRSLPMTGVDEAIRTISLPALGRAGAYAAASVFLMALMAWLFRENTGAQRTSALSGAAVAAVAGGLLWIGGPYNLTAHRGAAYPPTPLTEALVRDGARVATLNRSWDLSQVPSAVLPPNSSLAMGWRDCQGYDSLYLAGYRRLANALAGAGSDASPRENGNMVFIKGIESPLFPLLGARTVVSDDPVSHRDWPIAVGFPAGPPYVYETRSAGAEAWLYPSWQTAADDQAASAVRPGLTAVVAPSQFSTDPPPYREPEPARPVALTRPVPGRLRLDVSPDREALLVVAEGHAPGWKARVRDAGGSSRSAPVLRANIAFQGVRLRPGRSIVEIAYEPDSFRVGLFLALLAAASLAAGLAFARVPACPVSAP